MKVELTSQFQAGEAPRADGLGEAHLRVLSNDPHGPEVWDKVATQAKESWPWFFDRYERGFDGFFAELTELEDGETDYDGYAFEQWFVCKGRRSL